jgi:hypothetical protein
MHASKLALRALLLIAFGALFSEAGLSASITLDGKISEGEWAGAQRITDFKLVQPLTGADTPYPTEAWVLSTPEGLAIGFRNTQLASVPRTRAQTRRDGDAQVDRVNLMVDYDGNGGVGYNFTLNLTNGIQDAVISNENNFSNDWDGIWQHAVSEDGDTWSAEMLIPWYIAPMQKASGDKRTIGIYLDRVIGTTGERMAWPAASYTRPRFLSDFAKIEIPQYSQSLLAITPYVVGVTDRVNGDTVFDAGADIYWKPNSRFQLTATLNPDFGQVESDELVVNFDAVETFFSDKRPFFTENQSLFNVGFGTGNSSLIYTRRVGGQADDGSGAGDVTAAIKLNGSFGELNYGVFAATEADEVGRDFYALRLTQDFGAQDFGFMATQVNRPFLDRVANVYAIDHHWKPSDNWNVVTQFVGSDIAENGVNTQDTGMQIRVNQELKNGWRQNAYFVHLGADLQLNDFGYLDRNSFNYLRYEMKHRITNLPDSSVYRSKDWGYAASIRYNDSGDRLFGAAQINRYSETRDAGNEFFEITWLSNGVNDLITRGNGNVKIPQRLFAFYERFRPRRGHWEFYGNSRLSQSGLAGIRQPELELFFQPTYHLNDTTSMYLGFDASYKPDWLIWQNDNLLGTFEAKQVNLSAGMQWLIGSKQDLRIKLETIALDAKVKQAWRVNAAGNPVPSNDSISDFNLNNLGFQIRYRYELAPLSDLYVVYSRGGFGFQENNSRDPFALLSNSFSLRDDEQFLVKLSYRFSL